MRIPLDVRYEPLAKTRQIRVVSHFSCFNLGIGHSIFFLVDTGAVRSLISERDAKILEIDYSKLELRKDQPNIGVGGTSPLYKIKAECKLTFRTSDGQLHAESFPDFNVTKVEIADENIRKSVFNMIPSLLGMEVLERFKLYFNKDVAYLER